MREVETNELSSFSSSQHLFVCVYASASWSGRAAGKFIPEVGLIGANVHSEPAETTEGASHLRCSSTKIIVTTRLSQSVTEWSQVGSSMQSVCDNTQLTVTNLQKLDFSSQQKQKFTLNSSTVNVELTVLQLTCCRTVSWEQAAAKSIAVELLVCADCSVSATRLSLFIQLYTAKHSVQTQMLSGYFCSCFPSFPPSYPG